MHNKKAHFIFLLKIRSVKTSFLFSILLLSSAFMCQGDFLSEQKKYERVRKAYKNKEQLITSSLSKANIALKDLQIIIVAYKEEQQLEVYAKNKQDLRYKKINTYNICEQSGQLGPKRKQGDNQVPEGFYHIDRFNPASFYYLSLGINYPNAADRKKSTAAQLGGDIFIHGSCVTIGCLPMTDDKIQEIYLYAIQARQNGQLKIPVYLYPFKMNTPNLDKYNLVYKNNMALLNSWKSLKTGYDLFEKERKTLFISINEKGDYVFK